MEPRRDVFQAIADPTRRAIIDLVAQNPVNVNAIASQFSHLSRQAVSLHVKVLYECGLLTVQKQGRERICQARLKRLSEVNEWVARYQQFWTVKLDALASYLDHNSSTKTSTKHEK